MKTRVYVVQVNGQTQPRLVRATFDHTAIRHVLGTIAQARVASKDDLVTLMTQGVKVEDSEGPEPPDPWQRPPEVDPRQQHLPGTEEPTLADLAET